MNDYYMNKKSYNKISKQWNEIRNKLPLNKCIIDFETKIKAKGKILDIGCGTGYPISKYFADKGFLVTGIDISENMIEIAKNQNLPNAIFYCRDFFEFKPTEKYDAIIAFDSLFHFPKEKQNEIYHIVSQWMNIGAYLLFTHGNKEGEITSYMYDEPFYYSSLNIYNVHKLLLDNDFVIESSIENYKELSCDRDLLIVAKKVKIQNK